MQVTTVFTSEDLTRVIVKSLVVFHTTSEDKLFNKCHGFLLSFFHYLSYAFPICCFIFNTVDLRTGFVFLPLEELGFL